MNTDQTSPFQTVIEWIVSIVAIVTFGALTLLPMQFTGTRNGCPGLSSE